MGSNETSSRWSSTRRLRWSRKRSFPPRKMPSAAGPVRRAAANENRGSASPFDGGRRAIATMRSYDIVIAGAGPAGSTLALLAARRGARVMLVERSRFDRPRVGETAPPEFRAALSHLGLGRLVSEPLCCDAAATTSIWGEAAPRFRHHIVSPYGPALHLDRNAFDKAFASEAENAGADVRIGCDV